MSDPYVYVGVKDGMWCAAISHDIGSPERQADWLKSTVGPTLGEWMADGLEIITTYSRAEYEETLNLPMWKDPQGKLPLTENK